MKVLVLGSGGREHAIAAHIASSPLCDAVFVMPGNPGMRLNREIQLKAGSPDDLAAVQSVIQTEGIELVIVGPEAPLAAGIVDSLEALGVPTLGPKREAARLESSKCFAKRFMETNGIPTAPYRIFENYEEAVGAIDDWQGPMPVIKLDQLAAGKGVFLPADRLEAKQILYRLYRDEAFPLKATTLLFEQRLKGREVSAFALCDGTRFLTLGYACDYKRLLDGNLGPNTGGMGCYTPNDFPSDSMKHAIDQHVFKPVIEGMRVRGTPFRGILFAGIMADGDDFNVLEFNVRLGDPETQTLLPLIQSDLLPLFDKASQGRLVPEDKVVLRKKQSVHVVMASGGYPGTDGKALSLGHAIEGMGTFNRNDVFLYSAGVAKDASGDFINQGGRVLGVTALGDDLSIARASAYEALKALYFNDVHYRSDIALA